MGSVRKNISLKEEQAEFVDNSEVNLSKVTQDALEKLMD